MAIIGNNVDTLANWAKTRDPNGKTARIVELLTQSNEIINYMPWMEANDAMANRTTQRVSQPTAQTRQIGEAVPTSTSRVMQITEGLSIIEAWSEVDVKLADLSGDTNQYRFNMSKAFFQAMSQKFANLLFYGDTSQNPKDFNGYVSRYNALSTSVSQSAKNVINAGGAGSDNTSLWLITLGDEGIGSMGLFPKGSPSGLQHMAFPAAPSTVVAGYPNQTLLTYKDQYTWDCGLTVPDWRYNVRICNIDVSNLNNQTAAANLINLMIEADYQLPTQSMPPLTSGDPQNPILSGGARYWVCNRTVRQGLEQQMLDRVNPQLTMMDYFGRKVMSFRGYPFLNVDQISNAETLVS